LPFLLTGVAGKCAPIREEEDESPASIWASAPGSGPSKPFSLGQRPVSANTSPLGQRRGRTQSWQYLRGGGSLRRQNATTTCHGPLPPQGPPVGCPGPCGVQRSESADNTPVRSFLKHSLLHSVSASTVLTQSNFSLSSLASSVRSSKLMIDVIRETLEWPGPESAASTGEGTHGGRKKASVYSVSTDASYRSSQVAATTHGDFESNCGAVQAKPKMKLSCCAVS
jgi:hypothetical protein